MGFLSAIALDTTALRRSRQYRWLALSTIVGGLGQQAALVAVPYQVYVLTRSAALVGLVSAVELGPTIVVGLYGGAIADRMDRRQLLVVAQAAIAVSAGAADRARADRRSPGLADLRARRHARVEHRARLALARGDDASAGRRADALGDRVQLRHLTADGDRRPRARGARDRCRRRWLRLPDRRRQRRRDARLRLRDRPPAPARARGERESILRSVADGLRFVRSSNALLGSYVIDIFAMTFGMPRVLFVVLSLNVYHAGAAGTGLLYAAVAAGAAISALTTGWLRMPAGSGGSRSAWSSSGAPRSPPPGSPRASLLAALLFAAAGAADSISAICRGTISQLISTEEMRGRMSAAYGIVVTGGARLGDIEAGEVAALTSARFSVAERRHRLHRLDRRRRSDVPFAGALRRPRRAPWRAGGARLDCPVRALRR